MRGTLLERIFDKISPEPNSGCWLWTGCVGSHGYGQIFVRSGTTVVHRILYEIEFGPIPEHLECDHLCRVRCCVNPAHLELVTRRENIYRGIAPSARYAQQTHCKNGHPFEGNNLLTYKTKYGIGRKCRICRDAYKLANKEKIKARMRDYYYEHKGQ